MKLHLHFLDMAREGSSPDTKLMLAMTQFWRSDASDPVVMTFGTTALRMKNISHSTRADTGAIMQLLLRKDRIEGDLAFSLNDVARRMDQDGKPTWLHSIFGLEEGAPFDKDLIGYSAYLCELGPRLAEATIEVFVHHKVAEVLGAYRPANAKPNRGAGAATRHVPLVSLDQEARGRLANRLLGAVQITKLTIQVQKNRCGTWTEVDTDFRVLPLTSKDIFQLVVECDHEAYIYVVWVGSSGDEVTPIFPWLPPNWEDQHAQDRDQPRQKLVLTKDYIRELPEDQRHLQSIGAAGAETLVVIAHASELNRQQLKRYFEEAVRGIGSPIPYHFQDIVELITIERRAAQVAGFGLGPGPEIDPLAALKGRLEALPMRVDACKALIIPTLGGK